MSAGHLLCHNCMFWIHDSGCNALHHTVCLRMQVTFARVFVSIVCCVCCCSSNLCFDTHLVWLLKIFHCNYFISQSVLCVCVCMYDNQLDALFYASCVFVCTGFSYRQKSSFLLFFSSRSSTIAQQHLRYESCNLNWFSKMNRANTNSFCHFI